MYHRLIKVFGFNVLLASNLKMSETQSVQTGVHLTKYSCRTYRESKLCYQQCSIARLRQFCTSTEKDELSWEDSKQTIVFKRLESALLDCKEDEAWAVFSNFKSLYGFPPPAIMSKLISGLSYSSDQRSLPKACNLVSKMAKENFELLQHDSLSRLCLSLGRAQMPVPASKILRLMLQRNTAPALDVLCPVFMHMVKTEVGTCLASNILLEICDRFQLLSAKRSECAISMKPSTTIFNLVLEACVKFGSSLKGLQIIEAMARVRVVADVYSVLLFSYIFEKNGLRDELKKFKGYVDQVSIPCVQHYVQFYDKLLSLHYDFDDVDAAASMVEDIYFLWGSRPLQQNKDLMKPCQVPVGPLYLKEGLNVQVMFELLQKDFVFNVKDEEEFVVLKNRMLILTSKGWARLIVKYKKSERISELSKLLASIQKIGTVQNGCLCCDVIHACIYSGCLETAHDILDDMETADMSVPASTYMLLLNAYCKGKMSKEAKALAKQIVKIGLLLDPSDEMIVANCLASVQHCSSLSMGEPINSRQSELTACLVQELNTVYNAPTKVYELNSSMFFFCKAKMLDDALKVYKTMQAINIQPTVQTFVFLVKCYLSLEMYRESTHLWGDIKRYMDHGCSLANRDLYELLLLNFLRGGYFERVLEVLHHMKEHRMYTDRWMYKQEFLRLHKNLYRSLKAMDARTEAQRLRLEHVKAFRTWVRNN